MTLFPRHRCPALFLLVVICAGFGASGCHRTASASASAPPPPAGPLPFTGHLTEIEGVQAIVTLRPPKLLFQDVDKLIAGIPEMALARMGLVQLTPFGYPEFSDIEPGSNVGIAVLKLKPENLDGTPPVVIGFAKLKAGGKIATLLAQAGLVVQAHGDWSLIAKSQADLDALQSPDAVIAYLQKPQAEDIRTWVRWDPELLGAVRRKLSAGMQRNLSTLTPEQRTAAVDYLRVFEGALRQIHSLEVSLALTDAGIEWTESVQALPDSPLGTAYRYPLGPPPAIGQRVSGSALVSFVGRQNPRATAAILDWILGQLAAVNYPPLSGEFRKMQATYAAVEGASDGGMAGVFNLAFTPENRATPIQADSFFVQSGHFTPDIVRAYAESSRGLVRELFALIKANSHGAIVALPEWDVTQAAATIDGIPFDRSEIKVSAGRGVPGGTVSYFGVVNGDMVIANSEATLRQRVPALLAGAPLPDGLQLPDRPDLMWRFQFNGSPLVDQFAAALKLDQSDPDVKAQIATMKSGFDAAGPAIVDLTARQAKVAITLSIPYKFIEANVHFFRYLAARKANLSQLFGFLRPPPRRPAPPPAAGAPQSL